MRRPVRLVGAAALSLTLLVSVASAQAFAGTHRHAQFNGRQYLRLHGYLPLRGVATLRAAKAHAARAAARLHPAAASASTALAPTIGSSWQGVSNAGVSPADPNGAIGPNSYVEIINLNIAIYTRAGALTKSATLTTLTGHSGLSDPMVLWDPDTQRFYYNVWNTNNATMDWGFSKDNNPTAIPGSFCRYTSSFGYAASNAPDYPKLGQTKDFLMVGVNFYPSFSSQFATKSDLLWMSKPQGSAPITTCPAASTFKSGKFSALKNQDGSQAFTPVPAIQTDANKKGYVLASSDIECPPNPCPTGTLLTVYQLKPSAADPTVPTLSAGHSTTVGPFTAPPDAPQKGTANLLDTLDGRLTHAVSGKDPTNAGGAVTIWTSQTVLGGAGAQVRWYEVKPTPLNTPSVVQQGAITDPSLYVFNGAVSPDRTVGSGGSAHGGTMVGGFTTSSSTVFEASQMVSKIGAGAQSAFVLVKQSTTFDHDFTCAPTCRWGDYGGATADPAASLAGANGEVWLTNQWTNGTNQTWNWEGKP